MSKSSADTFKENLSDDEKKALKHVIRRMEAEHKRKDYIISSMKAEIRMLKDSLIKVRKISKVAIDEVDSMNEFAGACLDDGRYLEWDGKEIYYDGEETPKP